VRPQPGTVIANRYRLERPLAAGGMGAVWVARHLQLDIDVAVKLMSESMESAPDSRARFEREAKAVARLSSPHVVRAYDYGIEHGTPFIAMELLRGESLEARLRRLGALGPGAVEEIVRQIAKGLREAHALGIVHRDLKPANIFIASSGGDEIVKILDFGIAKDTRELLTDDHTKSGTLLGSPLHMSPEQAGGGTVDIRSDLWSLAVVMFRSLTGKNPFAGATAGDVIAKICGDAIPRPSTFAPSLDPSIDAFFARALRRNPSLRFQTVDEMAIAFSAAVTGAPGRATSVVAATTGAIELGAVPRDEATADVLANPAPFVADGGSGDATHVGTSSDFKPPKAAHRTRRWALPVALGVAMAMVGAFAFTLGRAKDEGPRVAASESSEPEATSAAPRVTPTSEPEASSVAAPPPPPPTSASASPEASVTPPAITASERAVSTAPRPPVPKRPSPSTSAPPRKPTSGDPFF